MYVSTVTITDADPAVVLVGGSRLRMMVGRGRVSAWVSLIVYDSANGIGSNRIFVEDQGQGVFPDSG
jgi:hypothetical protein